MQFGWALLHIIQKIIRSDPSLGPVYLSKIDIANGFYRMSIRSEDVPKLAIIFPTEDGGEQLIYLPLVLPMDWKQSPPLFTAVTEMVADIANSNRLISLIWCRKRPSNPKQQGVIAQRDLSHYCCLSVTLGAFMVDRLWSRPGICMLTTLLA
jgi:hypothetical protein